MSCYINYPQQIKIFQITKVITMLLFSNSVQINISTAFSEGKKMQLRQILTSLHSEHLKESPHSASFKIATLLH